MINPLVLFGFLLLASTIHCYDVDRIRLTDINVLTLHADEYTTARRGKRYPQVKCVGGTGKHMYEYHPKVVQCYNRGDDGYDVQWECKADLPTFCSFGKMRVSCEGYESSKDPYVLRGSCALEYELDCRKSGKKSSSYFSSFAESGTESLSFLSGGVGLFTMIAVLLLIYFCCISTRPAEPAYPSSTPHEPAGPPPPGFNLYPDVNDIHHRPPPYEDHGFQSSTRYRGPTGTWNKTPTYTQQNGETSSGPGFWSGAFLGGLTGYFLGGSNSQPAHTRTETVYHDTRSRSYPSASVQRDSDDDRRTASGFATTSRR